jgi:hypothetical protein
VNGGPIGPRRTLGHRVDVYSDVNLPEGEALRLVARNVSITASYALIDALQHAGWKAVRGDATLGAPPGRTRRFEPLSAEQPTSDTPD